MGIIIRGGIMNNIYIKKTVLLLNTLLITVSFVSAKVSPQKINYIKSKYEHTLFGKAHLFYPAQHPKRLWVTFTSANKNKYEMCSWYWNEQEKWTDTAYLFLKDDDFCWYLGNNKESFIESYSNIINHYISVCKLTKDQVFTIGGSMGAYAAIFYATILGLKGVVAISPQVDKASNEIKRYALENTGSRWQDLDKVVALYDKLPNISLTFSYNTRDESAGYKLIDAFKCKTSTIIIRRHPSLEHKIAQFIFSKEFIESEIAYLKDQRPFTKNKGLLTNKSLLAEEET